MRSTALASTPRQPADNHSSPSVGYVAREFINRITPLAACADELRRMELPADARALVEIVSLGTARAARTVRSLANLGSCRLVSRAPCSPNDLVAAAAREFSPMCRELGIKLDLVPASECATVMLDVSRMLDGLAHVLDVASDACSLLSTEQRPAIEMRVVGGRPGGLAILVGENGAPIPDEAIREAFDAPLHDGAPSGGTSLALFLARSALATGGGELVLTVEDGWTRFEISLAPASGGRRQEAGGRGSGPPDLRVIPGSGAWPARNGSAYTRAPLPAVASLSMAKAA